MIQRHIYGLRAHQKRNENKQHYAYFAIQVTLINQYNVRIDVTVNILNRCAKSNVFIFVCEFYLALISRCTGNNASFAVNASFPAVGGKWSVNPDKQDIDHLQDVRDDKNRGMDGFADFFCGSSHDQIISRQFHEHGAEGVED